MSELSDAKDAAKAAIATLYASRVEDIAGTQDDLNHTMLDLVVGSSAEKEAALLVHDELKDLKAKRDLAISDVDHLDTVEAVQAFTW